jgi:hypothetical protein
LLTGNKPRFFVYPQLLKTKTFSQTSNKNGAASKQGHLEQRLDFSIFQKSKNPKTKISLKTKVFFTQVYCQ